MKKKILSLFMVIAITIFNFIPFVNVHAEGGIGQTGVPLIQHQITVKPSLVTLYVGNVSKEGISQFKYLYSSTSLNVYELNYIKNSGILTPEYETLLPTTAGQVKVSNDSSITMDWHFTNANDVASIKYTGNIIDTSNIKLYNETKYNEAVANAKELASAEHTAVSNYSTAYNERKTTWENDPANASDIVSGSDYSDVEEYCPPVITNNDLTTISDDYIIIDEINGEPGMKYSMVDGHLKPVSTVEINRRILKIVNTSANVTDIAGTTKYPYKNENTVNSYNITSNIVTLYVGNVSKNGTSQIRYLYTDKEVNETTLTEMKKILTSEYASLLPTTAGQVKVSNNNSVTVNDVFTDAGLVAANMFEGKVEDTSSAILYNQTEFNNLASKSKTEVSDEVSVEAENLSGWNARKTEWEAAEQAKVNSDPNYTPVGFPEEYTKAFNDSTTYPTTSYFIADNKGNFSTGYFIRNGKVTQLDTYPINRTIIKVVNTSANVTTEEQTKTYEYIDNTANQTYTINKDDALTFRINADYSLFENGGKVYVDGTETTEYTSKSGSTIITLNKDYVNLLSVGEHTLKVAFNNGGEATTKFTIAKAEETKTEESTNNPQTGDNIMFYIGVLGLSVIGLVGAVIYAKKRIIPF